MIHFCLTNKIKKIINYFLFAGRWFYEHVWRNVKIKLGEENFMSKQVDAPVDKNS